MYYYLLDSFSHLHKTVCLSIRLLVGPLVRLLAYLSLTPVVKKLIFRHFSAVVFYRLIHVL